MEDISKGLLSVIKRFFIALISTLGILTLFGIVLEKLEKIINASLYSNLGKNTVLFTAAIGTPLHEISHWIGCKIFGFQVNEVVLLRPKMYRLDGVLGYVSYSMNPNSMWQRFGCFFVGIAPMIFGNLFILLSVCLLKPEIFSQIKEKVNKVANGSKKKRFLPVCWASFLGFWKGLFSLKKLGWLRGLICLYIVMSISMHMTISSADIESAKLGVWIVLGIYGVFALVTAMIGNDYVIPGAKTAACLSGFLSIGLLADALLLAISLAFSRMGDINGFGSLFKTINLNKYIIINEEGYDHYGTISVSFDAEKFVKKYGDRISRKYEGKSLSKDKEELLSETMGLIASLPKADKKEFLSNGDVISFSWDDEFLPEFSTLKMSVLLPDYKIKHDDFEYKVQNLTEVKVFDPFKDVSVSITGVSGAGGFKLETNSTETQKDITFSPRTKSDLSNGDTVTVNVKIDNVDEYVKKYNELPYPTEKVYEVSGLDYYAMSTEELGEKILTNLNEKAEQIALQQSETWVDECSIKSAKCVGFLFLSREDQKYKLIHNKYVPIIEIQVVSSLEPKIDFTYYFAVEYRDLLMCGGACSFDENGNISVNPSFAKEGKYIGNDENEYTRLSFKGFEDIDSLSRGVIPSTNEYSIVEKKLD